MILRHLRQNLIAYLALAVALGTGTAYAADQIANGSVTTKKLAKNAVTSPKIKTNAVKSADVKDGALTASDLAPGVMPGVTWVGGRTNGGDDPSASPDHPGLVAHAFTLPRAGTLQVTAFFEGINLSCTVGLRYVGLYVDGAPIPGTRIILGSSPTATATLGVVPLGAGPHTVTVGLDCPDGTSSGYDMVLRTYSLALGE